MIDATQGTLLNSGHTQRASRDHSKHSQRSPRDHPESIQRSLRDHPKHTQRIPTFQMCYHYFSKLDICSGTLKQRSVSIELERKWKRLTQVSNWNEMGAVLRWRSLLQLPDIGLQSPFILLLLFSKSVLSGETRNSGEAVESVETCESDDQLDQVNWIRRVR